jgi:hypothetical protein
MIRPSLRGPVGIFCVIVLARAPDANAQDQDFSVLRINEVMADNSTTSPRDIGGSTTDMIEIYNTGDITIELGTDSKNQSIALSDTLEYTVESALWKFGSVDRILPGDSIIVFCDGNDVQNACEPHASFQISSDGSEPITLWGPVVNGNRAIIDQVWLPPLPSDVSFGRYPDGAGPAPVPLAEVRDVFVYNPPGEASFGSCTDRGVRCLGDTYARLCRGGENGPGANLEPRVERSEYSTNAPAPGEPVSFTVRVEDDKEPAPPNIAAVEIVYTVDGGTPQVIPMMYDSVSGIQQARILDMAGNDLGPNPFNVWTLWTGSIPGQPQGAQVEFHFRVRDAEGLEDTSPETLCDPGVGPCHREFGGPDCPRDTADVTCSEPSFTGVRFVECSKPFTYAAGYAPRGDYAHLVINEVLARQDGVVLDPTENATCEPEDLCPGTATDCCRYRDDVIEVHNTSPTVTVTLSGLWLSSSPFGPRGWRFPDNSLILPRQYVKVWLDNDGDKCPDPNLEVMPCFWECPDPTDAYDQEFHTNFSLNADGDQIYIFDDEDHGFGVIHGVEFGRQDLNHSLSLRPDGDRNGNWVDTPVPTIGAVNSDVAPEFIRGDADGNCGVEITDAVFLLNFLFIGSRTPGCMDAADAEDGGSVDLTDPIFILNFLFLGNREPPAPGPFDPGPDPTEDELLECVATECA